jgi:dihydrofolate reductase
MSTVFMHAVVSVDGFIADADDNVGPLFDGYFNGDAEIVDGGPFKVSRDSVRYVRPMWQRIGTTVMGRHLFDLTNGWEGTPPAGEHIVVVTHRPRPEGWHPEASCQFIDDIGRAIMLAKELAATATLPSQPAMSAGRPWHSDSSTRSRWTSCPWCSGAASGTSGPSTCSSYWRIPTS